MGSKLANSCSERRYWFYYTGLLLQGTLYLSSVLYNSAIPEKTVQTCKRLMGNFLPEMISVIVEILFVCWSIGYIPSCRKIFNVSSVQRSSPFLTHHRLKSCFHSSWSKMAGSGSKMLHPLHFVDTYSLLLETRWSNSVGRSEMSLASLWY